MKSNRLLITAMVVENRPVREVAATYGASTSWLYELLARYRREGDAVFEPRSRSLPCASSHAVCSPGRAYVTAALVVRRDDVTYLDVGAVRRIESVTAADEPFELRLEYGEFTLPRPGVLQLGQEQGVNVGARYGAVAAKIEDAGHLDQGESGCLSAADERESGEDRGVVLPVSIATAARLRQQPPALVEADGLRRHARGVGNFSDAHDPTLRLDLALWIKV